MEFLGSSVRKHFEGFGWFAGRVVDAVEVNGRVFGRVQYDDGDCEDLPIDKLRELVVTPTTKKTKAAPTVKKKIKKLGKQKKKPSPGSKRKTDEHAPAPARKQPARVASLRFRIHYDVEEEDKEALVVEKTVPVNTGGRVQDKNDAPRLLTNAWDDKQDAAKPANGLADLILEPNDSHRWMEPVNGSQLGGSVSALDRRIHPLDMSVPKGARTERKPVLYGGDPVGLADPPKEFTIRSLPTIHRRLRKSMLCMPTKGPTQMITKPRRGRPPKLKNTDNLTKRPHGRPRKPPVRLTCDHPSGPSPSGTMRFTETMLPPPLNLASPLADVPSATTKEGAAAIQGVNRGEMAATNRACSWKEKPFNSRWEASELREYLGSSEQGWGCGEVDSIRSSQNSQDGLPVATLQGKLWQHRCRSKRRKTENQPPSLSLSPLAVDTTSCQDSIFDSDMGLPRQRWDIDQRCPYASQIRDLSAGMHGPVAPNWRGRPGVCLPSNKRTATPCSTISVLVQKELVKLGERLWWRSERGRVLSVGWATLDGILCGRCGWVVDVIGFGACVGVKTKEPRAHIWAANGMSLLELMEGASEDGNEQGVAAE